VTVINNQPLWCVMSEENAALAGDTLDQQIAAEVAKVDPVEAPAEPTESAPADAEIKPVEDKPHEDGFQKRINKVTADKYAEQRRADAAEAELERLRATPAPAEAEPTLEAFDYDEQAYNAALIKSQVAQAVQAEKAAIDQQAQAQQAQQAQASFNERIAAMNKPDFADVAKAIPTLPDGVADALVQSEHGAELIYHLGHHLDQADKIAQMSPLMAMQSLGEIAANLNAKPKIKTSAAPEPITPITSGGSLKKDISEMTMEELYNS